MSENSGDLSLGYMMGQGENRSGGFGNFGEGIWAVIILAILFGNGNFGGLGGGGNCQQAISSGFALNGLENGIRGLQQGLCDSTYALNNSLQNCCCETQRAIERGFCDTNYNMATNTRDIIDANNANHRALMDFLVQEKLSSKDATIADLRNQLSQSNQNAVLRAAIDASTAEIIRRTGNETPVPAYMVPNPYCCYGNYGGTYGSGYGYGYTGGCGCGV